MKCKLIILGLLLSITTAAWAGTTYYVDPNGDDANDGLSWATAFATIAKGITEANDGNSTSYAVVDVNSGTYTTGPIIIDNNNLKILFEENVEVVAISNVNEPNSFIIPDPCRPSTGDCLFAAWSKKDIIFDGNSTIFRMNKTEYEQRIGEPNDATIGEGRHVITLRSCSDVNISGLILRDSGGDGISLYADWGNPEQKYYCENIIIEDVNCDNNRRNGISVISIDGLTIENCILQNTNGTSPECGIDFEPSNADGILKNIVMSNSTIRGNTGKALYVNYNYAGDVEDLSMVFENVTVQDGQGIWVGYIEDNGPGGAIKFKNVTVKNTIYGTVIYKSSQKVHLSFENCVWKDIGSNYYPIKIYPWDVLEYIGGIDFINCQVFDDVNRPAITFIGGTTMNLHEIHGDLHVTNPNRPGDLYDWDGATLHHVDLTVHRGLACTDINDADPNWNDVNDSQVWDFYLLDANDNGYWASKKYLYAATSLDANHCQTNAANSIPHYHFESDFNSAEITAANRYWDWYYDANTTGIVRDSNATNQRDSLAYAMDGYAGSANYDYWIAPCETSNKIFTDDCTKRDGTRPATSTSDRIVYKCLGDIYRQATKVTSAVTDKPEQIQWKCQYSGVYHMHCPGPNTTDCWATPGRDNLYQNTGSSPTGTYAPNYWEGDNADVYYSP